MLTSTTKALLVAGCLTVATLTLAQHRQSLVTVEETAKKSLDAIKAPLKPMAEPSP